jgi:hypothetical protein
MKFISLLHHADVDALRRSFYQLKKTAAVGIDGITWQEYEHDLIRVRFHISTKYQRPIGQVRRVR